VGISGRLDPGSALTFFFVHLLYLPDTRQLSPFRQFRRIVLVPQGHLLLLNLSITTHFFFCPVSPLFLPFSLFFSFVGHFLPPASAWPAIIAIAEIYSLFLSSRVGDVASIKVRRRLVREKHLL